MFKTETKQKGIKDGGIVYSMSCIFYAMAGLIRIVQGSNIDGSNLIMQSYVSYMSDVKTLGTNSTWHPVDRYFAVYTCLCHFYTLITSMSFITNIVILAIGYAFLVKSQEQYTKNDKKFAKNHTMWHFASIPMAFASGL